MHLTAPSHWSRWSRSVGTSGHDRRNAQANGERQPADFEMLARKRWRRIVALSFSSRLCARVRAVRVTRVRAKTGRELSQQSVCPIRSPRRRVRASRAAPQDRAPWRSSSPSVHRAYFAAAGNAGSFSTSRASCWMITVALEFAAIFLRRSSDAIVCARS